MMSWVSAVVWVMKQDTCGVVIAEVSMEKGTGSASPFCSSSTPQSMVRPSSRAGVPVLSRARAQPGGGELRGETMLTASRRSGLRECVFSPIWIRPLRKVPVVSTAAAQEKARPSSVVIADEPAILQHEAKRRPFDHREVGLLANLILHRRAIEPAIGLCPRPANGRSLRAIEQAKLNAGAIGDTAHQTIQGVDLTHQMTFAQSADGRIAGHLSDRRECMREQGGAGAKPRCRRSRLHAGMPATHHDHIERGFHGASIGQTRGCVKAITRFT